MKVCGHAEDVEDSTQDVLIKSLPYLPSQITGIRKAMVRLRLHRGRLMLGRELERLASARQTAVHAIDPAVDKGAKRHTASCRKIFADLSDYVDGLVSDPCRWEIENNVDDCQSCGVFLIRGGAVPQRSARLRHSRAWQLRK